MMSDFGDPEEFLLTHEANLLATTEKIMGPGADKATKLSHVVLTCSYFDALLGSKNPSDTRKIEILCRAVCAAPELLVSDSSVTRAFEEKLGRLHYKVLFRGPPPPENHLAHGYVLLIKGAVMKATEFMLKTMPADPARKRTALGVLSEQLGLADAVLSHRAPEEIQEKWAALKKRMDSAEKSHEMN